MNNTFNKILSKYSLTLIILLSVVQIGFAQSMAADSTIKKGVLPNGMTYYLHATSVVKEVASYYLIQNVGSALEEDHQMGLAHFLEHMAFNGTAAFPEKTFLKKMEANGLVFGRDINAYTSLDETVYNINNVPTTPEMTQTGLQILHDWSNDLLLADHEIDAERGVIKEEWRTRMNGQARVMDQLSKVTYGHSKYAHRSPIGDMKVVENFKYQDLKDFYHDWYRTDLQAIAVIGDFDLNEMESNIKTLFNSIPALVDPKDRIYVRIEDNEKMQYGIAMDEEVTSAGSVFLIRHEVDTTRDLQADLKQSLLNSMIINMLNLRIQDIWMTPESPFVRAGSGYGRLTRLHEVFSLSIQPKKDQQQEAFSTAMKEVIAAKRFGFSRTELDRAIAKVFNDYENYISGLDTRSHQMIAGIIMDNFLRKESMSDIHSEFELVREYLEEISLDDIRIRLNDIYTSNNRALVVTGVEGENNLTEDEAIQIITDIENDPHLKPVQKSETNKSLMDEVNLSIGSISGLIQNEIGYSSYVLSNGMKVHFKRVDYKKNSIALEAISKGGSSLVMDADLASSLIVGNLYHASGLGDFSASELRKELTGKSAYLTPTIRTTSESFVGSSSINDIETLMQLLHLSFVKPRFDESSFEVVIQGLRNQLQRLSEDNRKKFQDSIKVAKYGIGQPRKPLFTEDLINQMSFEQIKKVYQERYHNPADFGIFITGDITKEVLEPLLSKYIANLPVSETFEDWEDNWVPWKSNQIEKEVHLTMDHPKSSVVLSMERNIEYSMKNKLLTEILQRMLTLRYTETLREEEGGTYGAGVIGELIDEPREIASLSIFFDCNPEMVDELVEIATTEMDKIKDGEIRSEEFENTIKAMLKARQEARQTNEYYMKVIKNQELNSYNIDDSKNFEEILESMTVKDLQQFAKTISSQNRFGRFVLRPMR
ncbi:M16 family metallopeptidase [Reichenbachiella sp.]